MTLQISARLIDEKGRLTESVLAERAMRCAILADLVTGGALQNDADDIAIENSTNLLPQHDGSSLKDAAGQMVELGSGSGTGNIWTWGPMAPVGGRRFGLKVVMRPAAPD